MIKMLISQEDLVIIHIYLASDRPLEYRKQNKQEEISKGNKDTVGMIPNIR